ncbi:MAG: hypothetical protein JWO46_1888 [Nocardioidaceae bacterium]|nr:hypothetical protein [Nocardioidaceae bacterium]
MSDYWYCVKHHAVEGCYAWPRDGSRSGSTYRFILSRASALGNRNA